MEEELGFGEELLPLFPLEDPEEEFWLEDELEGVSPVLLFSVDPPEIAVAATIIGVAMYLKNRRHIIMLL